MRQFLRTKDLFFDMGLLVQALFHMRIFRIFNLLKKIIIMRLAVRHRPVLDRSKRKFGDFRGFRAYLGEFSISIH